MPTNIAIRLGVEGGAQLKRELEEAGRAGATAFQGVGAAADQAAAATDRLGKKTQEAADAARRVPPPGSGAGAPAPSSVPANVPTPSPASLREVERVRARLDEEYRNARQLERDIGAIGRGESAGSYSTEYAARLRGLAETKYGGRANDNEPGRQGLSSYDRMFVRYQAFDAGSQLYSGASPSIVAVQQGSQVLQQLADREGGLGAGLKQLGASALGLVTPFTVATTAVVGIGAAFTAAALSAASDQAALERATKGIGATTGATVSQLDAMARANAEAGKVSTSTAREMTASYAATGQIALPVIGDLTRVTADYAKLIGTDVTTATADLARIFSGDLTAGTDELAKKIGGLNDRTRQLVMTQIEQGDRSSAQATAAEYLQSTVAANTSATYGWAAAWEEAKKKADGYWEAAKRIAGIAVGVAPEGAQAAADRLSKDVDSINARRKMLGMDPLGLGDSKVIERDAARITADTEARATAAKKAIEDARQASVTAGEIARRADPREAQLSDLVKKRADLSAALDNPLARADLADVEKTERTRDAYTRAIDTMTDANGKLISSAERVRMQDQLRLDTLKATTAEEKAAVAERQKAFDLAGQPLTRLDAGAQITRAGVLARAEQEGRGGGGSKTESRDDFDRAVRSAEDRIRRAKEQAETYGMGAEATERFRVQQELLTAAQRAGRDVTPELTAQIEGYANQAAEAAKRVEDLRESGRTIDQYRSIGNDSVRGLVRDLGDAKSATDILGNAFDRLKSRVLDLASDSIVDGLFGKRGTSGGLLSGLLALGGGSSSLFSGDNFKNFLSGGSFNPIPGFADGGAVGIPPGGVCGGPQGCEALAV